MGHPEQKSDIAVLDIENRLRSASEILGGIANLIELSQELGDIDEGVVERLGLMACRVNAQAEFVRDQLVSNEDEEQFPDPEAVVDELDPVQPIKNETSHVIEAKDLDHVETNGKSTKEISDESVNKEKSSSELLKAAGFSDDEIDGFKEYEVKVLEKFLSNIGTKFRPIEFSEILGGSPKQNSGKLRTLFRKIEDTPFSERIKNSGSTVDRRYWVEPENDEHRLSDQTEKEEQDTIHLVVDKSSDHPEITVEESVLPVTKVKLTEWGLQLNAEENSLYFADKKIVLREEAVDIVKTLIGNGESMSFEDLHDVIKNKYPDMESKQLNGLLHELKNAFENYIDAQYFYDKTLRLDGELGRLITINGRIQGALPDFLAQVTLSA